MNIDKKQIGSFLTITIDGRLDTNTAPDLEKELGTLEGIEKLIFDVRGLEYISSAGLRLFLSCQKKMNEQGSMTIKNANEDIKDIFDITGFSDFLTIE